MPECTVVVLTAIGTEEDDAMVMNALADLCDGRPFINYRVLSDNEVPATFYGLVEEPQKGKKR